MESDSDGSTSLNLRDSSGRELVLGVLSNVDVARQFCSATLVYYVRCDFGISNDGGVLLARTDSCTVSGKSGVDLETYASVRSSNALSGENDAVSVGK